MREVTISVKTTFRLMKELSGLPTTDERVGLVNLLSREALGDIKAEERLPGKAVQQTLDAATRQRIANALGMPWMSSITTEDIVKFINANLTKGAAENIRLLEALRAQLCVSAPDQLSGAVANLKQNHKEAERDLEKEVEVSKYLRDCLQQIGRALNQTNLTPASITETALVYIRDKETYEHPDTIRVRSIKCALTDSSGHKYPDVIRRIKHIVELDSPVALDASLLQAQATLKLVEAFLTDPTKIYTASDSNATHMRVWSIACQIMEIIKGKGAVYAAADPTVF